MSAFFVHYLQFEIIIDAYIIPVFDIIELAGQTLYLFFSIV